MRDHKTTETIVVISAAIALMTGFLFLFEFPPRIDERLHGAIGKALAKQALALLGQRGQITVITRDTEAFPQPALEALLQSFKREIHRAGATIAALQLVQVDPLRPVDVPPGDFFELIRKSPARDVIVSFLGPPLLTEEQRDKLGRAKPKIVAFCSGNLAENIDLRQLFKAGLLHAAVVSRSVSSLAASQAARKSDTFDHLYRTVEAADLAALPSGLQAAQ